MRVPTALGALHVEVSGPEDGEAVLLWPSLLMDHTLWSAQVAHLAGLGYRCLALDPPGHGASDDLDRDFTLDECADVAVEVLDALGVDRCHWLGNSWGAMTGGTFAARHPSRAGRLVLMNGTASAAPAAQRREYALLLVLARVLRGLRWPLTRSVLRAFLGPTSLRTRPEAVAHVLAAAGRARVRSVAHAVRSVVPGRPDQAALLGSIATPTLVVAGLEDATFPVSELTAMASAIPGSRLVVLGGAAHLAALEVPDEVNALVAEFLRA